MQNTIKELELINYSSYTINRLKNVITIINEHKNKPLKVVDNEELKKAGAIVGTLTLEEQYQIINDIYKIGNPDKDFLTAEEYDQLLNPEEEKN